MKVLGTYLRGKVCRGKGGKIIMIRERERERERERRVYTM